MAEQQQVSILAVLQDQISKPLGEINSKLSQTSASTAGVGEAFNTVIGKLGVLAATLTAVTSVAVAFKTAVGHQF